ncbi:MAG: alcohol dehydrogenase catalytic domain-containing protein [Anaerolineales bacterium]|jgi:threonine 3-dehydrogenase
MLAIAKTAPEFGVEIIEADRPNAIPGHIVIQVATAAICGGDLKIYRWDKEKMKKWSRLKTFDFPRILGHEISGTVLEVGDEVEGYSPGDRVAIESHFSCGRCAFCLTGRPHLCEYDKLVGIGMDGGFAEYVVLPARVAVKVPPEINWEQAALLEPLGVSMHAIEVSHLKIGDHVAVIGCGPIGLYAAILARSAGASRIVMSDISEARVTLANDLGFHAVLHDDTDAATVVKMREALGGNGAEVVLDAAGAASSVRQSVSVAATSGRVILIGTFRGEGSLDTSTHIVHREVTVTGISGRFLYQTWNRLINVVSSGIVDPLLAVTHRLPLSNGVEAFKIANQGEAGKILLYPPDSPSR